VVIELLRTFLEVNRTRHFGRAAENLHVGQSTVSARIRQLEERVGTPLFTRQRNDIELTAAGLKLLPYAESLVANWQRVRQELMAAAGTRTLMVGGVPSLWGPLLLDWVARALAHDDRLSLNVESLSPEAIARRLSSGSLDLAFAFDPVSVAGVVAREVARLELVLVSSRPVTSVEAAMQHYIYVDWGTAFSRAHAEHFPVMAPPRLRLSTGRLAQDYLAQHPGSAYLAAGGLEPLIAAGDIFCVPAAPVISRGVYALYPETGIERDLVERLLERF